MITGAVSTIITLIEALIALRLVFRFVGANPANGFVDWIYDWSTPFVTPFAGIFGQDATVAGKGVVANSVFDWTALVALIIYGLVGGLIIRLTTPSQGAGRL